jgi:hypothetical protein
MTIQRIVGLFATLSATTFLSAPALLAQESPAVEIMAEDPQDEGLLTGDELDELFAPVALYPDALLGQLLLATTYPLELVKADTLLRQNAGKSPDEISALVAGQDYPDPVKALAAGFPDLVGRMVEHIGWVEYAGEALVAQTDDSIASIQRLRAQAKLMGYLEDNAAMTVEETDAGSISIASTNPEVVYVPQYTEQVYTTPAPSTPVYVTEENNWDDLLVTGALVWGGATLVNEIFDDDDDWDGRWDNYWNDGRYGNHIDWDGDVNIDNSIDIGNIDNRPNKRPGKGDGKNDGKPGQNNGKPGQGGDGKPGQNNGKPGQGGDGKPGQNNGKPGQGGDGKPGQNNGKPGQNNGKPGQGNGKPGQGAGGNPEVGQGGNAGGAIAGGVAGGIAGGAMNRPSTRPAGPSTRPAIDEARPGSVNEDRVKAAKGGNFQPTETDKEAARAKIKTRKAEGKPPAALPPAKSKGDRVGKPSTRPASAPKPKLTKPAPAKTPVVKAPAKAPTVSRPPSISKPKTTIRPSSASKPKTTVKRTPSFKPSGSGSRAKAASSRGKFSRKGKR